MRFLLLAVVLAAACSTDTFTGDDSGGVDGASSDAVGFDGTSGGDAKADAVTLFDPSMLGSSLVLWIDAADAKTGGDASDVVLTWPDHQNKYTTVVQASATTQQSCTVGLHLSKLGTNNHPAVAFCAGLLSVTDAPGLHLGTAPFFIEAVISPPQGAGTNDVLFTKTGQGDTNPIPSDLTLLAPSPGGNFSGTLNSNTTSTSQANLEQKFQYVGFVRTSTTVQVRVDGQAGTTAAINSSDDASFTGNDIEIGAYRYDIGQYHDLYRGSLAELVIVTDPSRLGDIELYFKKKYGL